MRFATRLHTGPILQLLGDAPQSWSDQASCRDTPVPDAWFPDPTDETAIEAAVAVCQQCPVRLECLDDALAWERPSINGAHGIRGGLTEDQRRSILRARNDGRTSKHEPDRQPTRRAVRPQGPQRANCGTAGGKAEHSRNSERWCALCRAHERAKGAARREAKATAAA